MIPDLSVAWIIVFVIVLSVVFDRLLLGPVLRVMNERETSIRAARELAESSRQRAQDAAHDFDTRTRQARGELYQQMDEKRRHALDGRSQLLAETRHEVEQLTSEAAARIRAQADAARTQLDRDADQVASTIVERVLGTKAS